MIHKEAEPRSLSNVCSHPHSKTTFKLVEIISGHQCTDVMCMLPNKTILSFLEIKRLSFED